MSGSHLAWGNHAGQPPGATGLEKRRLWPPMVDVIGERCPAGKLHAVARCYWQISGPAAWAGLQPWMLVVVGAWRVWLRALAIADCVMIRWPAPRRTASLTSG